MYHSDEFKQTKKIRKHSKDSYDWDGDIEDRPPKGRHNKHSKKIRPNMYDDDN